MLYYRGLATDVMFLVMVHGYGVSGIRNHDLYTSGTDAIKLFTVIKSATI